MTRRAAIVLLVVALAGCGGPPGDGSSTTGVPTQTTQFTN